MSSPSAAVNSDAAMVQGRPISSEKNEKILDGMKAMHLGGTTSSSHPTSGMAEPTARQSNKHSNAGRLHTKNCSIYRYIYYLTELKFLLKIHTSIPCSLTREMILYLKYANKFAILLLELFTIVYCYLLGVCHTYSICFDYTQL